MSERGTDAVRVIRRYANRKLYDTTERAFTSLPAVEELIREGNDVRVVDHVTGEDVTDQALARLLGDVVGSSTSGVNQLLSTLLRASGDLARSVTENVARTMEGVPLADVPAAEDEAEPSLAERVAAIEARLDELAALVATLVARR